MKPEEMCADCAGYDIEWMRECKKHKGVKFCRGCECPYCVDDEWDDYEEDGPRDLEDVLTDAFDKALPAKTERCPNCDDTGDVHRADGEWLGICTCPAGQSLKL